ncbi:putative neugrin [Apostichopus japonicus]|uniref:Putative neugrin n=1 Tax=Stichopus japonicus TaxID=307972 RepID=A0A2G8JDT8_STIJA|nr:putative neugrin [Apostichopus japonicus]
MFLLRGSLIASCSSNLRHYASLSPLTLKSNRGFREQDATPGSDAIFKQELKKMKHNVDRGLDTDLEDDGIQQREALNKVTEDVTKRSSAMNYAKRAKYLGSEREKRSLTWDNIDKIRFLRQEHPQEWSLSQLAASFEVSETTIKKVLKSKYNPTHEKRKLHDTLVLKNTGREKKVKQPPTGTSVVLDSHKQSFESSGSSQKGFDNYPSPTLTANSINGKEQEASNNITKKVQLNQKISRTDEQDSHEDDWEEMENVSLEDELEEAEAFESLNASDFVKVSEDGVMPPKIVQKGKEFYDTDGEFLFRI